MDITAATPISWGSTSDPGVYRFRAELFEVIHFSGKARDLRRILSPSPPPVRRSDRSPALPCPSGRLGRSVSKNVHGDAMGAAKDSDFGLTETAL